VNFIGHAYVALWHSSEPSFVLGTMLPDFVGMAGTRLSQGAADHTPLGRGIALHHRTDDVFHGAEPFLQLTHATMERLIADGLGRGPARAVGHLGVEMLLDGELLSEYEVLADAYRTALDAATQLDPARFAQPDGHDRFRVLAARLSAYGVPYDYRNTEAVAARLFRILARRPRLAIAEGFGPAVEAALQGAQRAIVGAIPGLTAHLREQLSGH
jgi:hypothetical protein